MAGEDPLEQKNLGSLSCRGKILFGLSAQCRTDSGIISCDVVRETRSSSSSFPAVTLAKGQQSFRRDRSRC